MGKTNAATFRMCPRFVGYRTNRDGSAVQFRSNPNADWRPVQILGEVVIDDLGGNRWPRPTLRVDVLVRDAWGDST